ncbi:hypothetical protein C0992_007270, partial [Termitomyces sp. T32_za158]
WYKRSEFGLRAAMFFTASSISGAFGGLLADKILNYLPVIEGLATVVAGIASFWVIQDFPDTAKFLSEAERTVVVRRLQGDDQFSAAGEKLRMKYIWAAIKDWKTWVGSMYTFALSL